MSKPTSAQNSNSRDLPVLAGQDGTVVLPEAGWQRTISALDYKTAPQAVSGGQSGAATYTVTVNGQANTATGHSIVIEAPAGNAVRIMHVRILNPGSQTSAGLRLLQLIRTTSAGTGGTVTPAPHDTADSPYGGIARAKPTTGTESTVLQDIPVYVPTAVGAFTPIDLDFGDVSQEKAFTIAAGTTNGIALKDPGAAGGANFSASITFTVVA